MQPTPAPALDTLVPPPPSTSDHRRAVPRSHNTHHSYGTRIRQNALIRPSARARQHQPDPGLPAPSPTPRRIRPVPATKPTRTTPPTPSPPFPPSNVVLHPEDAANKVLSAIGRAFLASDNCAMTIKDLAELSLAHGLRAQNASAAGQAISTFIRTHQQRCEDENDQPLLLSHTLSGTAIDDDLLPALHSREGGAHSGMANSDAKVTSFRKGTMVWYLSKAAGGPCPFARAGIRLRDYDHVGPAVKPTNTTSKEKKRERELARQRKLREEAREQQICGRKRKRLTRSCADRKAGNGDDSDASERPPKVKISLRLKPLAAVMAANASATASAIASAQHDSEPDVPECIDLSMDDDDDPSETDMPLHSDMTESVGTPGSFVVDSPQPMDYEPTPPPESDEESVEDSEDSEDEDSDEDEETQGPFWAAQPQSEGEQESADHESYREHHWSEEDEDDIEFEFDPSDFDEGDADLGGSPAPQSPMFFKQESSMNFVLPDPSTSPTTDRLNSIVGMTSRVKLEDDTRASTSWLYPSTSAEHDDLLDVHIKQEESDVNLSLTSLNLDFQIHPKEEEDEESPSSLTVCSVFSPLSPVELSSSPPRTPGARRSSEVYWTNLELQGPEDVPPEEFDVSPMDTRPVVRTQTASVESAPLLATGTDESVINGKLSPPVITRTTVPAPVPTAQPFLGPSHWHTSFTSAALSVAGASFGIDTPSSPPEMSSSLHSWSSPESTRDSVGPPSPPLRGGFLPVPLHRDEPLVYTTAVHTPTINATRVEGIPVFQAVIGTTLVYRRADTGFVYLNPICSAYQVHVPDNSLVLDAFVLTQGSSAVIGTWAPLESVRAFVRSIPHHPDLLEVFLSDDIAKYFPDTLRKVHDHPPRPYFGFGPPFRSTLEAQPVSEPRVVPAPETPWERGMLCHDDVEGILASKLDFSEPLTIPIDQPKFRVVKESPLSPVEKDMFYELCGYAPEWEDGMAVDEEEEDDESSPSVSGLRAGSPSSSLSLSPPPELGPSPPAVTITAASALKPKSMRPAREPTRRSKRVADATVMSIPAKLRTLPARASKRRSAI